MHEEPVKLFSPRKSFLMCFFPVQRQFPYINPYFVLALVSVPYWSLVVLFILCGDLLTFWSTQCHTYSSINSSCFQVCCIAELANDFILDITGELVFSCIFLWHFILKWDLLEQLDKYVHPWRLPYEYIGMLVTLLRDENQWFWSQLRVFMSKRHYFYLPKCLSGHTSIPEWPAIDPILF